jgi:hypothetical protein
MESHPEDALVLLQLQSSGTEQMRWKGEVREHREVRLGNERGDRGG